MKKYVDIELLTKEIDSLYDEWCGSSTGLEVSEEGASIGAAESIFEEVHKIIDSLSQEQPKVDLEKLGEIVRHLIAVKQNVEDMRLSEDEWSLLERIGYPERFNAGKKESK